MTVRSADGLDELTTTSKNKICLLKNGQMENITFDPQNLGLHKGILNDIQISTKEEAITSFVSVDSFDIEGCGARSTLRWLGANP